ncbi:MAG: flagellar hook protein FlgE [Polyangiaceae bacterium]|nr:flagellar hook protein FlgE [Polyangiaceae bacterium]
MSITKAMWAGVSGLSAEGQALGVVGDNVANSNTIGFKQSRAVFEDVLGGAMGQNLGGGVRMARTQQLFAQGSIVNTGQASDLALTGDGFFVVDGTVGGVTGQFFTRAGQFTQDSQGFMVTPSGLKLQGYAADGNGGFGATVGDVQIPSTPLPPKATTSFDVVANLDANETPPALPWDPANPAATSNYSTSTTVYDSLGNAHAVDVYYVKTAAGWDYHAMVDGGEVSGGTPGTPSEIASGSLTFTTNGYLDTHTAGASTVDFNGATPGQNIAFNFGTPISAGGTGQDGITQYGSPSNVTSQEQDGYASGSLTGIQVDGDGVVNGVYSNGEQIAIAQLAVAKFQSNDGLARAGQNVWMATRDSGEAAIAAAGSGGRAAIVAGALEQSNVDIAQQFVEMISHQRAFQANSKTITTADEMLQELVNLKR